MFIYTHYRITYAPVLLSKPPGSRYEVGLNPSVASPFCLAIARALIAAFSLLSSSTSNLNYSRLTS